MIIFNIFKRPEKKNNHYQLINLSLTQVIQNQQNKYNFKDQLKNKQVKIFKK